MTIFYPLLARIKVCIVHTVCTVYRLKFHHYSVWLIFYAKVIRHLVFLVIGIGSLRHSCAEIWLVFNFSSPFFISPLALHRFTLTTHAKYGKAFARVLRDWLNQKQRSLFFFFFWTDTKTTHTQQAHTH